MWTCMSKIFKKQVSKWCRIEVAHKAGESLFLKLGEPLNWRKLYTNPKIWRIQDLLKAGHKIGEQDCYVV